MPIYLMKNKTIQPNQHAILECSQPEGTHDNKNRNAILTPNEILERERLRFHLLDLAFTCSISKIKDQNTFFI